jgi:hypothetical protein
LKPIGGKSASKPTVKVVFPDDEPAVEAAEAVLDAADEAALDAVEAADEAPDDAEVLPQPASPAARTAASARQMSLFFMMISFSLPEKMW